MTALWLACAVVAAFAAGFLARPLWDARRRASAPPSDVPVPVATTLRRKSAAFRRRTGGAA